LLHRSRNFTAKRLRRLVGTVRGQLFECDRRLMAAERGQAPRRDAIDPVAPVIGDVG
jgi:hypothetical protein